MHFYILMAVLWLCFKHSYLEAAVDVDDEAAIDAESTLCESGNLCAEVKKDEEEEGVGVPLMVSFLIQKIQSQEMSQVHVKGYFQPVVIHGSSLMKMM